MSNIPHIARTCCKIAVFGLLGLGACGAPSRPAPSVEIDVARRAEPPAQPDGEAAPAEITQCLDDPTPALACPEGSDDSECDSNDAGMSPDARIRARYQQARVFYEANRWEIAAPLFLEVALDTTFHEIRIYAASLYLDAVNLILAHRPSRSAACLDELGQRIPQLAQHLCSPSPSPEAQEICRVLENLDCAVAERRAESLLTAESYREASLAFEQLTLRPSCTDRRHEEALYNAAIAAERGEDIARAHALRARLRELFPESALLREPTEQEEVIRRSPDAP